MSKLMTWIWKFISLILKHDDLKYLQKPNLDVTKLKLLHLYSNMTYTHESKCTISITPRTICDMQPNDIEINKKKNTQPSFMRQISKQNVIQEKHKVNDLQAFARKSLRGHSSINCYNI